MKSFNAGDYVFLNNEEHRMHKFPFRIISKIFVPSRNEYEYCIENRGRKLFVNSSVLYEVDSLQLNSVIEHLGGKNVQTY
jgi:hypothetical protein